MFGVTINHVRLRDTAEAVTRVVAERQAGRNNGGSVDLIWINGPNFLSMKSQGLLFGPFAETLPNWRYVDTANKRSNVVDFTVPVEGLAAPGAWRRSSSSSILPGRGAKTCRPPWPRWSISRGVILGG